METQLLHIFGHGTQLMLLGLVAAALFFLMAGLRDISSRQLQGMLFLALGGFFLVGHFLFLASNGQSPGFWSWLTGYLVPALVILFICFGTARVLMSSYRAGMYLLFFGLTLYSYQYLLGAAWPVDVKGIIALAYSGAWIDLGLRSTGA